MKASARTIKETLENCGKLHYEIAPPLFAQSAGPESKPGQRWESVWVGCERRGERITIKYKNLRREEIWEKQMYYCNGLLMDLDGLVFKRT